MKVYLAHSEWEKDFSIVRDTKVFATREKAEKMLKVWLEIDNYKGNYQLTQDCKGYYILESSYQDLHAEYWVEETEILDDDKAESLFTETTNNAFKRIEEYESNRR